jgi:hypothetical protein
MGLIDGLINSNMIKEYFCLANNIIMHPVLKDKKYLQQLILIKANVYRV